eukprot:130714-Hanusia_phi.AAC.2
MERVSLLRSSVEISILIRNCRQAINDNVISEMYFILEAFIDHIEIPLHLDVIVSLNHINISLVSSVFFLLLAPAPAPAFCIASSSGPKFQTCKSLVVQTLPDREMRPTRAAGGREGAREGKRGGREQRRERGREEGSKEARQRSRDVVKRRGRREYTGMKAENAEVVRMVMESESEEEETFLAIDI